MNIIFQVSQFIEKTPGINKFSFLNGLKIIWSNLKLIGTGNLLVGNRDGWKKVIRQSEKIIVSDKSLVVGDDQELRWIDTPQETNTIALSIEQKV